MPDDSNNSKTRVGAMAPDASTSPVEADVLPDDRNILRTTRWGGAFAPNMTRCRCRVSYKVGRGWDVKQCAKPVKVTRIVDGPNGPEPIGYCGTHDPVAVSKRDKARIDRWSAEREAKRKQYEAEAYVTRSQPHYYRALVEIAQGADNPRAVATAALTQFDALPPTPEVSHVG